jgi:HAD superfamily hydrolase (TIGR01509 family)
MLPRPVHAVVFDMDGLLVDSEAMFRDATMHVAAELGHVLPLEVFLRMIGLPSEESRKIALDHFGANFPFDAFNAAVWARAKARHEEGVPLKPGVTELLDHLDRAGIPRAIATSSSHGTVELQLGRRGLKSRFDTIVAAGDYARGKPSPDPYLTASERLAVEPELCLALEDSHNGVRAASAAGMMTVMVPDLLEATSEMRALCCCIAPSLHHVLELLRQPAVTGPASLASAG